MPTTPTPPITAPDSISIPLAAGVIASETLSRGDIDAWPLELRPLAAGVSRGLVNVAACSSDPLGKEHRDVARIVVLAATPVIERIIPRKVAGLLVRGDQFGAWRTPASDAEFRAFVEDSGVHLIQALLMAARIAADRQPDTRSALFAPANLGLRRALDDLCPRRGVTGWADALHVGTSAWDPSARLACSRMIGEVLDSSRRPTSRY